MTSKAIHRLVPDLRSLTPARVSLAMSGNSISMREVLELQLAHAHARDAVHTPLDSEGLTRRIRSQFFRSKAQGLEVLTVRSRSVDRATYLRHPGMGRSLDAGSAAALKAAPCDLAITIADGLSAVAVEENAVPLLALLLPRLEKENWTVGPVTIVQQGRVAICDAIGEKLAAKCSLILIGERPGLSAADSMGAYLTWKPRVGRTDADRNCVSNIRSGGLEAQDAAERLMWLLKTARTLQATGVDLKMNPQPMIPS